MTSSRGLTRPRAVLPTLPASSSRDKFSSTLVGWLIQTAFVAVVEGTCETFSDSRGSNEGRRPGRSARFTFPLNFYQHALISRAWGRESKLSMAGRVAGERRRRRPVSN